MSRSGNHTGVLCDPWEGSSRSNIYIVKMASRDKTGERMRSNRLRKGMETTDTPPSRPIFQFEACCSTARRPGRTTSIPAACRWWETCSRYTDSTRGQLLAARGGLAKAGQLADGNGDLTTAAVDLIVSAATLLQNARLGSPSGADGIEPVEAVLAEIVAALRR